MKWNIAIVGVLLLLFGLLTFAQDGAEMKLTQVEARDLAYARFKVAAATSKRDAKLKEWQAKYEADPEVKVILKTLSEANTELSKLNAEVLKRRNVSAPAYQVNFVDELVEPAPPPKQTTPQ